MLVDSKLLQGSVYILFLQVNKVPNMIWHDDLNIFTVVLRESDQTGINAVKFYDEKLENFKFRSMRSQRNTQTFSEKTCIRLTRLEKLRPTIPQTSINPLNLPNGTTIDIQKIQNELREIEIDIDAQLEYCYRVVEKDDGDLALLFCSILSDDIPSMRQKAIMEKGYSITNGFQLYLTRIGKIKIMYEDEWFFSKGYDYWYCEKGRSRTVNMRCLAKIHLTLIDGRPRIKRTVDHDHEEYYAN